MTVPPERPDSRDLPHAEGVGVDPELAERSGGTASSATPPSVKPVAGYATSERPTSSEPSTEQNLVEGPATEVASVPVEELDLAAFPPLANAPDIGNPGRQREVVALAGELTTGVADTLLDFMTLAPFEIRACATRGHSHRQAGTPRQDWYAIASDESWLVVAVADGVSQARHSHVAAETAARAACRLAMAALTDSETVDWDLLGRRVSVQIAREAVIRGLVDEQGPDEPVESFLRRVRQEMCTTLVIATISRVVDDTGACPVSVVVIAGDSGAFHIHPSGFEPAGGGKDAEAGITSTSVRPLPGIPSVAETCFDLLEGAGFVMVSDGVGDALGSGLNDLAATLAMRWQQPPLITSFMADVNFFRRTYDDDRTVVGVWRLPVKGPDEALPQSEAVGGSADGEAKRWADDESDELEVGADPVRGVPDDIHPAPTR